MHRAEVVLFLFEHQAAAKLRRWTNFAVGAVLDDLLVDFARLAETAEDAETPHLEFFAGKKEIADLELAVEDGIEVWAVRIFLDEVLVFLERLVVVAQPRQRLGQAHTSVLRRVRSRPPGDNAPVSRDRRIIFFLRLIPFPKRELVFGIVRVLVAGAFVGPAFSFTPD